MDGGNNATYNGLPVINPEVTPEGVMDYCRREGLAEEVGGRELFHVCDAELAYAQVSYNEDGLRARLLELASQ